MLPRKQIMRKGYKYFPANSKFVTKPEVELKKKGTRLVMVCYACLIMLNRRNKIEYTRHSYLPIAAMRRLLG